MLTVSQEVQRERLLSYVIASSDMRYIEIGERIIYLRQDPQLGLVMQGELPECSAGCHVNLSEMFLEYTMSCDDCRDPDTTARNIDHFGRNLGNQLLARLDDRVPERAGLDGLSVVMDIILNSMGAEFQKVQTANHLQYKLAYCPLHAAARALGLNLWVAPAHSAFVALCNRVLHALAPDYALLVPAETRTEAPLECVLIAPK